MSYVALLRARLSAFQPQSHAATAAMSTRMPLNFRSHLPSEPHFPPEPEQPVDDGEQQVQHRLDWIAVFMHDLNAEYENRVRIMTVAVKLALTDTYDNLQTTLVDVAYARHQVSMLGPSSDYSDACRNAWGRQYDVLEEFEAWHNLCTLFVYYAQPRALKLVDDSPHAFAAWAYTVDVESIYPEQSRFSNKLKNYLDAVDLSPALLAT